MPAPTTASLPAALQRRAISIGSVFGALALTVLLFPFLTIGVVITDLLRGIRSFRYVRIGLFVTNILLIEAAGILVASYLWLRAGLGIRIKSAASVQRHMKAQYWYTSSLLQAARTFCGLEIEIEGLDNARAGNAIVIGRHCSLVDAMLPSSVFGQFGHEIKYALAAGLRWAPNLDLYGGRLDNTFIDRASARGTDDIERLGAMAGRVSAGSVAAIFPEGTFFTPERREKVLKRIAERRPGDLARAEALRYLLPPQPAGTLALLEGAPDADVILMGHVGFESLSTLVDIRDSVPSTTPVKVRLWRFDRAEVPDDPERQIDWLYERWAQLDDWIQLNQ